MTTRQRFSRFADAFAAFVGTDVPLKLAVMMCAFLPAQALAAAFMWFTARESGVAVMTVLDGALVHGVVVVLVSALLSWLAIRFHWRGPFVLYLAVGLYSTYLVHLVHVLGTWSTGYLVLVPTTAFVCGVVFGVWVGWFSLGTSSVLLAGTELLRLFGVLDYAPGVRQELLDGSPSTWWVVSTLVPTGSFVVGAFAMTMAVVTVAQVQQHRLDVQAETLRRSHELIRRYVPSQVLDAVVDQGDLALAHERRKITVFFSDIVGFTELVDRMEPEEPKLPTVTTPVSIAMRTRSSASMPARIHPSFRSSTARCMSTAIRTARSAWSRESVAVGAPKRISTASPMSSSIVPSYFCAMSVTREK